MRLLILTQYYPPEIGAPQNRLHELAIRLKEKGIHLEVLTGMPNYPTMEIYEKYQKGRIKEEIIDEIAVHRAKIFVSNSKSIIYRLLNYFSFVFTSYLRGRKLSHFDFILVESPPLFLGYSAIALSKKLKAKLIFNVSDLWPESAEKLGLVTNKFLLKLAYNLEEKCYLKSELITCQTDGIVQSIKSRFSLKNVYWLPNGVDLNFYDPSKIEKEDFRKNNKFLDNDILFFYGGILGYAQGLDIILEAADKLKETPLIKFILQGSGPEKERLEKMALKMKLNNVYFLPPVSKDKMPSILKEIDVAIVPLRKLELFEGAIPSKIFECLAMEVPLLLGVSGESKKHFVDNANAGYYFEPENSTDLISKINLLIQNPMQIKEMGKNGRKYANLHFNRNIIAEDFYKELVQLNKIS